MELNQASAHIATLKSQRNAALDAAAQLQSELIVAKDVIAAQAKQIELLKAALPKEENVA